jgi:multiple sugar transport system permease protein
MNLSDSRFGFSVSIPGFILLITLVIFPIIALFNTSFLRYESVFPIKFIGLRNYNYILNDRIFWLALKNTVLYSGGVTALTFIWGLALALLLSKITRGSVIFRSLSMLPWAVPLVISGYIWKWMFDPNVGIVSDFLIKLHLIDSPLHVFSDPNLAMIGCIIADAWVETPFMCIFILAAIKNIPEDFYDAAKVDGADCFDTFRYITLPLISRMALMGILIISMFTFRTIDVIFSMTRGGPARGTYVIGYYVVDQLWQRVNFGTGSAAGVLTLLLIFSFTSIYIYMIFKRS